MLNFVLSATAIGCSASCFHIHSQVVESKPNIIILMADDLGWGDVGFNGNKQIKTPNLDALAAEGVVFERFYAGCAVSSPTRAGILTGRNPYRMGVFNANTGILRPEEVTLPELLKEKSYTTALFGKWHLGTLTYTETDANRGRPGNIQLYNPPYEHGFDESFITESKVPTYDPMKKPIENDGRFWDYLKMSEPYEAYGTAYWHHNGDKAVENLDGDDSRIIIDHALSFIDKALANNQPFFSAIWFHAPYLPCVAGAEYATLYQELSLNERNYFGCITALDYQVGKLVKSLKEKGIYENTIIFFCSDNGPEDNTPGTASHLRDRKRSLHEGGIRVPAFAVWKGQIPPRWVTNIPCCVFDILPTLVDISGLRKSPYPIDGESLLYILRDIKRKTPITLCFQKQNAVIDRNYKLYSANGKEELYDISMDPSEITDLAEKLPHEVDRLKVVLEQKIESVKASFEGKDYGTASYERLNQTWSNFN